MSSESLMNKKIGFYFVKEKWSTASISTMQSFQLLHFWKITDIENQENYIIPLFLIQNAQY